MTLTTTITTTKRTITNNYHQVNHLCLHHMEVNHLEDNAIFTVARPFMPSRHRPHLWGHLDRPGVGLPSVPHD